MPRKVFVAGEVLTAADVQEFLADQAVMTFADSAARGSAIGSAVEGMVTYLEDTDAYEYWDASAWVPLVPSVSGDNLLYNGAMQVAQRGTSETGVNSGGYYTADRWYFFDNAATPVFTQTVEADGPTGSGFAKSLKMEVTTPDASLGVSEQIFVSQRLEGQDLQGLKKGSSDAESLTVSFWVKSDTTGTYIFELFDIDNSRQVSGAYTIDAADTWERKSITIAGDASGAFDNDSARSLDVNFWLAAGSNLTSGTLNTSWAANTNANRVVGQTNFAASTGNYWQVAGVQLETGTIATGFDHKPFGVELAECQRYYAKYIEGLNGWVATGAAQGGSEMRAPLVYQTAMRASPSFDQSTGTNFYEFSAATTVTFDSFIPNNPTTTTVLLRATSAEGFTGAVGGQAGAVKSDNADAYFALDAEL